MYYFPIDIIDGLRGRDSMIPPKAMIFVGSGDFEEVGEEFKKYFIDLGQLEPHHRVLDVGCGIGRMAVPLTRYLSQEGEFWGFDIVKKGIEWCQKRITPRFSNFRFQHSDIFNKHYNKKGKVSAREYRFPFDDGSFDFVYLTSVFTHMLQPDIEHYMEEISRVLKSGGKCLITFFLLNDESIPLIRSGKSTIDFKYEYEECLTVNQKEPEAIIAYKEETATSLFETYGLKIIQPIHYGSWCGRTEFLSYQDMIIAVK